MSSSSTDTLHPAYRADIDGLRALSVIAVILFHFSVPGFRGGFVGVDIFFVISGYLITQLLVLRRELPFRRWLAEFYLRRARRILPALLLVLIVSAAAATWLFAPRLFRYFGKTLALSSAMLANLDAEQTVDYFGAWSGTAPLTHLWSIAVEEQFYLAYPLMLFLLLRFAPRRAQLASLAVVVLASFALCLWAGPTHPRANYYLPMTRAWELGIGALLGLRALEWSPPRSVRELLGVAALAAIIVSALYYDEKTPFPGWYALLPCLGAAVLIATGASGGSSVNRILALRPLVFVGLISYALYLWHVPLLVFRDYYMLTPVGALESLALLAALAAIAIVSWKWFEMPMRRRRLLPSNRAFLITMGAVVVGLAAYGYSAWRSDGMPQRLSREEQRIYSVTTASAEYLGRDCPKAIAENFASGELCSFGSAESPGNVTLLWGDSHAFVLVPAVRAVAERHGAQVLLGGASSCEPLVVNSTARADCLQANAATISAIDRVQPRMVILTAYWGYEKYMSDWMSAVPDSPPAQTLGKSLEATLRRIRTHGSRICVVRDVPTFPHSVPESLAMAYRRGVQPYFNVLTLDEARRQQHALDVEFDRLERLGLMTSVNPREALCASGTCQMADITGMPVYRDSNHISSTGWRFMEPVIEGCFAEPAPVSTSTAQETTSCESARSADRNASAAPQPSNLQTGTRCSSPASPVGTPPADRR